MILQSLVKYYETLAYKEKVARPGWCKAKVSYAISLSREGHITGILSLKVEKTRGKKSVVLPAMLTVPEMVTRSSGVSANFLCDNSKYLLGIDTNGTNERMQECFEAAKEKHLSILEGVEGEAAEAIRLFFVNWDPRKAEEDELVKENWEALTDGGNLIFGIGNEWAQNIPEIKEAWERLRALQNTGTKGVCLVTGRQDEISRIHKTIKGVAGAQSSGAALVSFNAPAFESYGKEQSYNAPVGKYAEFAYTTALNYLLGKEDARFRLGDSTIVFWAEEGEEAYQEVFTWSVDPKPDNREEIKGIFDNLKKGRAIQIDGIKLNPDQQFYILCLAPNAARLSVRFFYQNSFGKILDNLSEHYQRMAMVKPSWENRELLGIWGMLSETVNQKSNDKTPVPNMAAMVMQAIISGTRYPESLFTDTLIRIRAEQGKITWGRAGIIKAFLIKNRAWKEGEMYMGLNEESTDQAYVLGRMFSVLESIQKDANLGIKSTIRDRYFNSACATPASVFPILIKLKNSHMKKLEREKGGAKVYYERLLTDLAGKLEEYPKRLALEEQGKFILGYYHQEQKKYEKRGGNENE